MPLTQANEVVTVHDDADGDHKIGAELGVLLLINATSTYITRRGVVGADHANHADLS